jgi:hypothetical protein
LDDHFTTDAENKVRDQEVRLTLYLPEGTILNFNPRARDYVGRRIQYDQDMYRKRIVNYTWQMGPDGTLQCLDCPPETGDSDEDGQGHIIIDENGVDIDLKDREESFEMKIDEEGIRLRAKENDH